MKYVPDGYSIGDDASHLLRGAWIEILRCAVSDSVFVSRTSYEVRGLKYEVALMLFGVSTSHLLRGAWIEIIQSAGIVACLPVAPLTRCVD